MPQLPSYPGDDAHPSSSISSSSSHRASLRTRSRARARSSSYYCDNDSNNNERKTTSSSIYTWILSLLATFLLGTVIVLSIVKSFFGVDWNDVIQIQEIRYYQSINSIPYHPPSSISDATAPHPVKAAIHQTAEFKAEAEQEEGVERERQKDSLISWKVEHPEEHEILITEEEEDNLSNPEHENHLNHTSQESADIFPSSHELQDTPDSSSTSSSITLTEKIPRIIHQTWKTSLLPIKWASLSSACQSMHPDFEYKLWTDESSLEFIRDFYPWFLPTYVGYKFNIQRADAIRYFILHKHGGIYLDLDIGCKKPIYPLLHFNNILPATKPIGISNDLMLSEPNSPFMDSVIHNLVAFDHAYLSDYPTVMFSTGPMFLSAVLSLWNSKSTTMLGDIPQSTLSPNESASVASPNAIPTSYQEHHSVRILPQSLYGKNIDPELVPDSFFIHYYGSSWHQGDSAFFTFLGQFGKTLMNFAFLIVLLGTMFIVLRRLRRRNGHSSTIIHGHSTNGRSRRRTGGRTTRGRSWKIKSSSAAAWFSSRFNPYAYSSIDPTSSSSSSSGAHPPNFYDSEDVEDGYQSAPHPYTPYSENEHHRDIRSTNHNNAIPRARKAMHSAHQHTLSTGSSSASTVQVHHHNHHHQPHHQHHHRQRRKHKRKGMTSNAGARYWLFGGRYNTSTVSNLNNETDAQTSSSSSFSSHPMRRSSSTGAIQLHSHSSAESSSDERCCSHHSLSLEDGMLLGYPHSHPHGTPRERDNNNSHHRCCPSKGHTAQQCRHPAATPASTAPAAGEAYASGRPEAPPLHRRNSSQKVDRERESSENTNKLGESGNDRAFLRIDVNGANSPRSDNLSLPYTPASSSSSTSRSPLLVNLLDLPPPPPYRPPSPSSSHPHINWNTSTFLAAELDASSSQAQTPTHSRRASWFSALFSRSPSPAGLISPLPFFTSSDVSASAIDQLDHHHRRRSSNEFSATSHHRLGGIGNSPRHSQASIIASSASLAATAASRRASIEDTRGWSDALSDYSHPQYHLRNQGESDSNDRDSDVFSLHSVKRAQR